MESTEIRQVCQRRGIPARGGSKREKLPALSLSNAAGRSMGNTNESAGYCSSRCSG